MKPLIAVTCLAVLVTAAGVGASEYVRAKERQKCLEWVVEPNGSPDWAHVALECVDKGYVTAADVTPAVAD